MGHCFDLDFDARLSNKGFDIVSDFYRLHELNRKTVVQELTNAYTEYPFVERMLHCPNILCALCGPSHDLKGSGYALRAISSADPLWSVHTCFKDGGFD